MKNEKVLFPVFLDLTGRRCVVIGGGSVALRKIRKLLQAGADVVVVAPRICKGVERLACRGRVQAVKRAFRETDLAGSLMVIAATSDCMVNTRVVETARRKGIPVNVVDSPSQCDFLVPAVMQRGPLQIAVSTGGSSPAMAKKVRKELEKRYGPEYAAALRVMRKLRPRVLTEVPAGRRSAVFTAMYAPRIMALFRNGRHADARGAMERLIARTVGREGKES